MNKYVKILIFIAFIIWFWLSFIADDLKDIPDIPEPRQTNLSLKKRNELKFTKKYGDWKILYIPLAKYEISATVVASTPYFWGIDSAVARHDLGTAWGKLGEGDEYKKLNFWHGNRMLHAKYYSSEFSSAYVDVHVSNIHVIPKDNKILRKIRRIRVGDKIYLKGYLVRAEGLNTKTYSIYERESSLTRTDTGDGACETMYVEEVIYHHKKLFGRDK